MIELPIADSELAFRMNRSGITDIIPRCKLLEVSEENNPLKQCVGDFVNLDEVNFFAKRWESLTEYEQQVLNTFAIHKGISDVKGLINLTYSLQGLSVITELSNVEAVGKRLYMDKYLGMSSEDENNINFIEYADQVFREQKVEAFPYGLLVENGFEMQTVYNGKTFPEYIYNSDRVVAVVEVSNVYGEKEYLYLPTDNYEWEKAKARLGIHKFEECQITNVENLKLPQKFMGSAIHTLEQLTLFNEMCSAVHRLNDVEMEKLELAVDFMESSMDTIVTAIAYSLDKFEIIPNVHSDLEYGAYIISTSGEYKIPEELLPYFQYSTFAMHRRKENFRASNFVEKGFVGIKEDLTHFLDYQGEFADLLEFAEDKYDVFYLYSPLTAELYEDGCSKGTLDAGDLKYYFRELQEAMEEDRIVMGSIRGLMKYYSDDVNIAGKIVSAFPSISEIDGKLYGVLDCVLKEPLTETEIQSFKDYWTGQMSDGWGEGFEQNEIKTEDGELYVSFWNSNDSWFVKTLDEMGFKPVQEVQIII